MGGAKVAAAGAVESCQADREEELVAVARAVAITVVAKVSDFQEVGGKDF